MSPETRRNISEREKKKKFTCRHNGCNKEFYTKSQCERHLSDSHQRIFCNFCDTEPFTTRSGFRRHNKRFHKQNDIDLQSQYGATAAEPVEGLQADKQVSTYPRIYSDFGVVPHVQPQFMNVTGSIVTEPPQEHHSFGACAPLQLLPRHRYIESNDDLAGINWDDFKTFEDFLESGPSPETGMCARRS